MNSQWQPRQGQIVDFEAVAGARGLPSGRYQLDEQEGEFNQSYWLRGVGNNKLGAMDLALLNKLYELGRIKPVSNDEIAGERQRLQLQAAAPLRRPVVQADVDGLALFDRVRSPAFF